MNDAFEERKKALEDEYFYRKEKEVMAKFRAKLKAAEEAAHVMKCPTDCGGTLVEVDFEDLEIHLCQQCGGAWLDRGELEQLTRKESEDGFFHRLFG